MKKEKRAKIQNTSIFNGIIDEKLATLSLFIVHRYQNTRDFV
jgi:hypothetical protein